jgi:hypothetical protein
VNLAAKLQIKPGTSVAVIGRGPNGPDLADLGPPAADPAAAGAVIAFVTRAAELTGPAALTGHAAAAIAAAREDRLAWIAYPKAGQLDTDINRDSLARAVGELGVRPVRQVALDDVWSALRFRPA